MVRFEDDSLVSFALGEDGMIAVPVIISVCGERVDALVYRQCQDITERNLDAALSGDTSGMIRELSWMMEPYDYLPSENAGERILTYKAGSPLAGDTSKTQLLRTCAEIEKYRAETSGWTLEVDDGDPMDVLCAVTVNGAIVAAASVNDLTDDGLPEINVECAPKYRRQGFGLAVVVGLTNHLLCECSVDAVLYKCRSRNVGSAALAKKAGFTDAGYELPFVFYRNI